MDYSNIINKLYHDKQEKSNDLYYLEHLAAYQDYLGGKEYIGKCYFKEDKNKYYKVIEPEPKNKYRFTCIVFRFTDRINLKERVISSDPNMLIPIQKDDCSFLPTIESVHITNIKKLKEISVEDFEDAYYHKWADTLTLSEDLVAYRNKEFKKYKEENKIRLTKLTNKYCWEEF